MRQAGFKATRESAWLAAPASASTTTPTFPTLFATSAGSVASSHIAGHTTLAKARKLEALAEGSLTAEVHLYLEMARQQQPHRGHNCVSNAHARADAPCAVEAGRTTSSLPRSAEASGQTQLCDNPAHADAEANGNAVDYAVHETFRILRTCWTFAGRPQDAFEPVRHLHPITRHLLLTYGRHRLTSDGQYVVLNGAEEQMPYVGVLMDYLYRQTLHNEESGSCSPHSVVNPSTRSTAPNHFSPFRASYHAPPTTPPPSRAQDTDGSGGCVPPPAQAISRLLVSNCHSFGWMDSLSNADYDESGRALEQMNTALKQLVLDPAYAHIGRPQTIPHDMPGEAHPPSTTANAARCVRDLPAQTIILLANTVLMDGGVPSLSIAKHGTAVFAAHHQYGRGLACLVPSLPPAVASTGQPPAYATPLSSSAPVDSRGLFTHPPASPTSSMLRTPPLAFAWFERMGLPPLSCGTRSVPGAVTAQAVLLSPVGPLVLHLQYQVDPNDNELARLLATSSVPLDSPRPSEAGHRASQYVVQDIADSLFDAHFGQQPHGSGTSPLSPFRSPTVIDDHAELPSTSVPAGAEEEEELLETHRAVPPAAAETSAHTTATVPPPFTIADLPHVVYLAASGEALMRLDMASTVAQRGGARPSSAPTSPRHAPRGVVPPVSRALTLTAQLVELVEWVLQLMRSPLPVVLAEWQLQPASTDSHAPPAPYFGMRSGQPTPSLTFQLLEAYAEGLTARQPAPPSSPWVRGPQPTRPQDVVYSDDGSVHHCPQPPLQDRLMPQHSESHSLRSLAQWSHHTQEHQLRLVVRNLVKSMTRCAESAQFDGQERPLLFVRGLETTAETERFANATTVITSLQYRRTAATTAL